MAWLVAVLALQPPPLTRRAVLSGVTGVQPPPLTRRAILSGATGAISLGGVRRVSADDRWVPAGDPAKADSYLVQLKAGEKAMVDLLANWEVATKAAVQNAEGDAIDGDAVRRVVGSVGTSSPLFGVESKPPESNVCSGSLSLRRVDDVSPRRRFAPPLSERFLRLNDAFGAAPAAARDGGTK